ncbi:MAG: hypothetical protein ACI9S8_001940 [Chlamydiales bacterium]|jgi:hypothetical protein
MTQLSAWAGTLQKLSICLPLSEVQAKSRKLNELPTDLLESVFTYLNAKDLVQAGSVCRYWSKVQNTIPDRAKALLSERQSNYQMVKEFHSPSIQKIYLAISHAEASAEIGTDSPERLFPESSVRTTDEKIERLSHDLDAPRPSLHNTPILINLTETCDELLPQMELLLKAGTNPNVSQLREDTEFTTPLHRASFYSSVRMVNLLMNHHVNVDISTKSGNTVGSIIGLGVSNDPFIQRVKEKRRTTILGLLKGPRIAQ